MGQGGIEKFRKNEKEGDQGGLLVIRKKWGSQELQYQREKVN